MKLPSTWSNDEAKSIFKEIEQKKGSGENDARDWKSKLSFNNTSQDGLNNTTQRAVSGFANTFGGEVIIGFGNKGEVIGVEKKANIDNEIRDNLTLKLNIVPMFQCSYYEYKTKDILAIFIAHSKLPIRCDNGAYYHRESSQFKAMTHEMLERKFRENFEEEKWIYLVKMDLKQLQKYIEPLRPGQLYTISPYVFYFNQSGDKLYNFLKEKEALEDYFKLKELVNRWLVGERNEQIEPNRSSFDTISVEHFKDSIKAFLNKIS